MDALTVLTMTATSALSKSALELVDSGVSEVIKRIAARLAETRQEYEVAAAKNPTSQFEIKRQALLDKANALRNNVMLNLPLQTDLILPALLEQILGIYDAKSIQDLAIVETSIDETTAYVNHYIRMLQQRQILRYVAVALTMVALTCLIVVIIFGSIPGGLNLAGTIAGIGIPVSVMLWSAIGSFTAMLYRFNRSNDVELQDPMRVLFSRPLTGIVMGSITFLVVKMGILTAVPKDTNFLQSPELFWLIAFLAGFSDRFADSLLRSLVGRFGGDEKAELVNLESPTINSPLTAMFSEGWGKVKNSMSDMNKQIRSHNQPDDAPALTETPAQTTAPGAVSADDANNASPKGNGVTDSMSDMNNQVRSHNQPDDASGPTETPAQTTAPGAVSAGEDANNASPKGNGAANG
jgi:hypothetical protein